MDLDTDTGASALNNVPPHFRARLRQSPAFVCLSPRPGLDCFVVVKVTLGALAARDGRLMRPERMSLMPDWVGTVGSQLIDVGATPAVLIALRRGVAPGSIEKPFRSVHLSILKSTKGQFDFRFVQVPPHETSAR